MRTIASIIFILTLTVATPVQQPLPSFEEVVARMTAVNASLETFRVEQEVEARLLFFRYVLSATVYAARPARYNIVVHDPPWFLGSLGDEFGMVARPEDVLVNYSPRTVAWREEDGRSWLYLSLDGTHEGVNPSRVEAFIDPSRWLVGKTLFHYAWGDLRIEYSYGLIGGFYLPDVLQVTLPGYVLSATMRHHDYQLNIPIPEEVFDKK